MKKSNNIYEFPKAKAIVVSGDIHGDFTQLVFKCCVAAELPNAPLLLRTFYLIEAAGIRGYYAH
jgi:hypothetical protein